MLVQLEYKHTLNVPVSTLKAETKPRQTECDVCLYLLTLTGTELARVQPLHRCRVTKAGLTDVHARTVVRLSGCPVVRESGDRNEGTLTNIILEWTTSLDSSSGTLICPSLCPRHVGRNNYVPLFGVYPIEWRLSRYYVIRDVIVILEC